MTPARRPPSLTGPTQFCFLNEPGDLAAIGWDGPARTKLWRYNQHYFDDLNAQGGAARAVWQRALISSWIGDNPPVGGTGWEPYPVSLRIVNWVKWAFAGNDLPPEAVVSLAVQTRWLTKRLEKHLLGNHLFANAKALVFAGLFFDGPEARGWLDQGFAILEREVQEQILPDGGQFELSPMYHALAVEDVLDLINIFQARRKTLDANGQRFIEELRSRADTMLAWLMAMSHPDGRIAFFNDAAFGIAPDNEELLSYAERLEILHRPNPAACVDLSDSGYVRAAAGPALLLADVARIGADYLPAHGHADTLSFELSVAGKRLVVNSGTSLYGDGPERQRQRGTAAHSTLEIARTNSSEVWGAFRVGRRAKVIREALRQEAGGLILTAAHDGYEHLPGKPRHRRTWRLATEGLSVVDEVAGRGKLEVTIHFHFGPGIHAALEPDGVIRLSEGDQLVATLKTSGNVTIHDSTWHPRFGVSVPNQRIEIDASGPLPRAVATELIWDPL